MDEEIGVATADSPAATETTTDTSAGTQNTGTTGQPEPPFHQHPRWIERQREIETLRGQNSQLGQAMQELNARLQQYEARLQSGQGLTPEQQQQYLQAGDALEKILQSHPRLKGLLDVLNNAPALLQGYEGVQQLSNAQVQQQVSAGTRYVENLAKQDGLPLDAAGKQVLVRAVAQAALHLPDGRQRFDSGDLSVLDEAFQQIKGMFSRSATAAVLTTKGKTSRLPPRPVGGQAGPEAPPRLDPKNPRAFEQSLHTRAAAKLGELLGG